VKSDMVQFFMFAICEIRMHEHIIKIFSLRYIHKSRKFHFIFLVIDINIHKLRLSKCKQFMYRELYRQHICIESSRGALMNWSETKEIRKFPVCPYQYIILFFIAVNMWWKYLTQARMLMNISHLVASLTWAAFSEINCTLESTELCGSSYLCFLSLL